MTLQDIQALLQIPDLTLVQFQDVLMVSLATVIAALPNEIMALDVCALRPDYPGDPTGLAAFSIKNRKNAQRGHWLLPRIAKACQNLTCGRVQRHKCY